MDSDLLTQTEPKRNKPKPIPKTQPKITINPPEKKTLAHSIFRSFFSFFFFFPLPFLLLLVWPTKGASAGGHHRRRRPLRPRKITKMYTPIRFFALNPFLKLVFTKNNPKVGKIPRKQSSFYFFKPL